MNLSHYVDLVRCLTGLDADSVTAVTSTFDPESEVEDSVAVAVRFSNGALGSILGSSATPGYRSGHTELAVWGSHGHIVLEPEPRLYTLTAMEGIRTNRWQSFGELPSRNIRAVYMSRLATAIHCGEQPDVTGEDGLAVQAFLEAAYESNRTSSAVSPIDLMHEQVNA
jgi:predicted dehydrogenase